VPAVRAQDEVAAVRQGEAAAGLAGALVAVSHRVGRA
jgi:hypothetical protein